MGFRKAPSGAFSFRQAQSEVGLVRLVFPRAALFAIGAMWFAVAAAADVVLRESTPFSPTLTTGQYRLTYDSVALPGNESLGLLGGNYLIDRPLGYLGLGVYAAVAGRRGGFFTGGFEAGHAWRFLGDWLFDLGFFAGGGGGGGAPQGGGMMLRPHVGLMRESNWGRLGGSLSRVAFPNGGIASNNLSLQWEREFSSLLAMGWAASSADATALASARDIGPVSLARRNVGLQMLRYIPASGQVGRGGVVHDHAFDVLGLRAREALAGHWWGEFSTAGALGGNADGYAEIFAGIGYHRKCFYALQCAAGFQVGAAGGGDVDTGGGVVGKVTTGLAYQAQPWTFGVDLVYAHALDGHFQAPAVAAHAGYAYETLSPARLGSLNTVEFAEAEWVRYRIRAAVQRYANMSPGSRKQPGLDGVSVDLVALKLDAFLNNNLFVTGQAEGAFDGGAGGYATGLVGLGGRYSIPAMPSVYGGAELLLGAAGGGGLAVGGGVIAQPMVNFGVEFDSRLGLELGYGYASARGTQLRTTVIDVAMVYRLQAPRVKTRYAAAE